MFPLPCITLQERGRRLAGRLAFTMLFIGVVLLGAAAGLIFVYSTDLPEIRALEDYRPNVVTELYSDDGQQIGNFALQRRILLTWEQIPPVLKDAITSTEDQHFFEHWGVDLPRVMEAAWRNAIRGRIREGASTLTMQLAGGLFLDRSDRSFRRKIQETLLAIQIDLIGVHSENLLFRIVALDLDGQKRFLNLSAKNSVRAVKKKAAGQLHGERARAFTNAAADGVAPCRFHNARQIDSPMLEEMLVFGGGDRIFQHGRNLLPRKENAPLQGEVSDLLAVVGIKLGNDVGTIILESSDFRSIRRVNKD